MDISSEDLESSTQFLIHNGVVNFRQSPKCVIFFKISNQHLEDKHVGPLPLDKKNLVYLPEHIPMINPLAWEMF